MKIAWGGGGGGGGIQLGSKSSFSSLLSSGQKFVCLFVCFLPRSFSLYAHFSAGSSPERYWRGPRSLEVEGKWGVYQ